MYFLKPHQQTDLCFYYFSQKVTITLHYIDSVGLGVSVRLGVSVGLGSELKSMVQVDKNPTFFLSLHGKRNVGHVGNVA